MVGSRIFCTAVLSIWIAAAFAERCPCCGQTLPPDVTATNAAAPAVVVCAADTLTDEKPAPRDWKASVYGGFSAKNGNTVERSYKIGGDFSQYGKIYRGKLKADGRYSKTEDEVTASKAEASGEMRRMVNTRWFNYGVLSALHDDLKDLDYRIKTGPGLGYYFFDSKELSADISSGPLYVIERTTDDQSGYLAWRFAQGADWQITSTFQWWVSTEAVVDTTDIASYTVALKSGVESRLNSNLSLIVMIEDDYDSRPDAGEEIKKNDFEISTGLRYNF